jgi:hypothetical protein
MLRGTRLLRLHRRGFREVVDKDRSANPIGKQIRFASKVDSGADSIRRYDSYAGFDLYQGTASAVPND